MGLSLQSAADVSMDYVSGIFDGSRLDLSSSSPSRESQDDSPFPEEELEEYLNPSFFRRTLLYPLLMLLMMIWTVSSYRHNCSAFLL